MRLEAWPSGDAVREIGANGECARDPVLNGECRRDGVASGVCAREGFSEFVRIAAVRWGIWLTEVRCVSRLGARRMGSGVERAARSLTEGAPGVFFCVKIDGGLGSLLEWVCW